ncbi:MAG: ATP-dependent DNA ligase, partial [Pseudolysinimonas sp.]
MDDRVLAHLKVVITGKLRRGEPFLLSWNEKVDTGGGRGSLWMHPGCDLVYRFDGSRSPELD